MLSVTPTPFRGAPLPPLIVSLSNHRPYSIRRNLDHRNLDFAIVCLDK